MNLFFEESPDHHVSHPEQDVFDGPANSSARTALARVVCCGEAIAMAGAGVSAFLKYPDWTGLVKLLADETIVRIGPILQIDELEVEIRTMEKNLDSLLCARYLRKALGEKYFEMMKTIFGPREGIDHAMQILVELPFCHFFTTNYDPALELAHQNGGPAVHSLSIFESGLQEFIGNLNNGAYPRQILHVHGRYDEPEQLVLTEDDYVRFAVM